MSESSDDSSSDFTDEDNWGVYKLMQDGIVAIFESFMMRNEYKDALAVVSDCYNLSPTSSVINDIIYKIMLTCDSDLAYEASIYLEGALRRMPADDDQYWDVFIKGLKDKTGSFPDVWDAFSHFVLSALHHRKISESFVSSQEYVKSLNCDYLVGIYVKVFLKCPSNSLFFGYHSEEKFVALMRCMNVFYKYNVQMDDVLESLHLLLDHIFKCEISAHAAVPKCVAFHLVPLPQYILLILNNCKDAFVHSKNQQRFFNNIESPLLIVKICQCILDDLIGKESTNQKSVLTLKSIVKDYFIFQPEEEKLKQVSIGSPKKSNRKKSPKKARKNAKNLKSATIKSGKCKGDTKFHECCRSNKFADLLEALLFDDVTKDINTKNGAGNTPLHEACLVGSYHCCKFLIDDSGARKVDFRATDPKGRTPLHLAVNKGAIDIVKLLLNRGGPELTRCCDNDGNKPIDYSKSQEMSDLIHLYELKLKPISDESQASASCVQQKPVNLKNPQNYPLYLRTLLSLIANYCEFYDIPKDAPDVKILSHSNKECSHYKISDDETLCMDDSSAVGTMKENINKLSASVKCVSGEVNIEEELRSWNFFAASFE